MAARRTHRAGACCRPWPDARHGNRLVSWGRTCNRTHRIAASESSPSLDEPSRLRAAAAARKKEGVLSAASASSVCSPDAAVTRSSPDAAMLRTARISWGRRLVSPSNDCSTRRATSISLACAPPAPPAPPPAPTRPSAWHMERRRSNTAAHRCEAATESAPGTSVAGQARSTWEGLELAPSGLHDSSSVYKCRISRRSHCAPDRPLSPPPGLLSPLGRTGQARRRVLAAAEVEPAGSLRCGVGVHADPSGVQTAAGGGALATRHMPQQAEQCRAGVTCQPHRHESIHRPGNGLVVHQQPQRLMRGFRPQWQKSSHKTTAVTEANTQITCVRRGGAAVLARRLLGNPRM
eukprot:scaffold12711_cov120-Isochrysis_galbana.AAC.5